MTDLDELFMAETMTSEVVTFADQTEERSFLEVYEAGEPINPISDDFVYDEVSMSRGMAPVTGTQSPSKAHKPPKVVKRAGRIYAIKEHADLPANLFNMLRGAGQTMPDPDAWLRKTLMELTNRVQRTRNYWAALSLHQASVNLASFPNADAETALPTLTYPVSTLSASTSWALASTKIRSAEINRLKREYKRVAGYKPGCAYASDVVEGYLTQNAELSNTAKEVPTLAQRAIETSYLEGGQFMRFGGLDFKFVRDDYVTDANQETADDSDSFEPTVSDVISDADLMPVLPPRSRWSEVFGHAQGRLWIPTGSITSLATGSFSALLTEVRGWAAWLELITNPVGIRVHVAWNGNFIQKQRGAVQVFNTTP